MTTQLDWLTATRARDEALERCTTVTGDAFRDGAARFIVAYLGAHGDTPGEVLTAKASAFGLIPADLRHFGPVFLRLIREGRIEKCGECKRARGHRSAGGSVYRLVRP